MLFLTILRKFTERSLRSFVRKRCKSEVDDDAKKAIPSDVDYEDDSFSCLAACIMSRLVVDVTCCCDDRVGFEQQQQDDTIRLATVAFYDGSNTRPGRRHVPGRPIKG